MKLSDWAKKEGISYLTAYRWFKDGTLPVKAYQSDSGTIIVQDTSEITETPMVSSTQNDAMSLFLKKTVEFSKNQSSVEDFAAFVLSNFSLKLVAANESPKYSRNKPKAEDIQKHFQKFIKPKGEKPKLNMLILPEGENIIEQLDLLDKSKILMDSDGYCNIDQSESVNTKNLLLSRLSSIVDSMDSQENVAEPLADNITSHNYTNSNNQGFSSISSTDNYENSFFKPTQKELESASKTIGDSQKSRGRGRRKMSK